MPKFLAEIPSELHLALKHRAIEDGTSMKAVVLRILEEQIGGKKETQIGTPLSFASAKKNGGE